jgi:hypothetical protein
VIDHVARDANELLGDDQQTGFLIDESSFAKQGPMSVGASRQWLGRLGKVDNGQVAVFGVLAKHRLAVPVDVNSTFLKNGPMIPSAVKRLGFRKKNAFSAPKISLPWKL